jgi:Lrp/AsnC family transcriptional regulator for asnA, asnC and gidA
MSFHILYWYHTTVRSRYMRKIDSMGQRSKLDEIDSAILRLLKRDSRMSLTEMSRQMNISDSTIQFRIKRLKEHKIIDKFTITINPKAIDYTVIAIMLVQIDADMHDVAKIALSKIPEISEVYSVLGEYDLFIKVWSKNLEELNELINDKIRSIEGIKDLLEIVVVERVKEGSPSI